MNLALLMLLALLWAVVLLPSAVRSRRRSLHHSMGGFARTMAVLSGSDPAPRDGRTILVPGDPARIVRPPSPAEAARDRRRRVLVLLLGTTGVSGTAALLVGGPFPAAAFLAAVCLGAYVAALRRLAVQQRAHRRLVHLDQHRDVGLDRDHEFERAVVG